MNNKSIRITVAASFILFLACCVGVNLFYEPTIIVPKVSRTEGVAPLSVHFEASLTVSSGKVRPFHTLDYSWNFGDKNGAKWSNSGKKKNIAKGAVATHIFEKAGHYTVQLVVKDVNGVVETETFNINVLDPDRFYSGTNTTVVSDSKNADFTGAPAGSRQIVTDDLSTITQYVSSGKRILFRRGSKWTTGSLNFPEGEGPVTIGAFGNGALPKINLTAKAVFLTLSYKQDWRLMDLHFEDLTRTAFGVVSGATDMQRILLYRLQVDGFQGGLGWTFYNDRNELLTIDQMVVAECVISNFLNYGLYVGGERLALLGNNVKNSSSTHVTRVWQAYKSVISHNSFSGSSLSNDNGRHALKFHGPKESKLVNVPVKGTSTLGHRTELSIISDNLIGGSGPWPVTIGPQDGGSDERISDIIFENNKIISQYGEQSSRKIQSALVISSSYISVRNNLFDGTGSGNAYTAVTVRQRGLEPAPKGVLLYNNTVYRFDNNFGNNRIAFNLGSKVVESKVINNLISFPSSSVYTSILDSQSEDFISSNNVLVNSDVFIDANNIVPLKRNFRLVRTSELISTEVPFGVYSDFDGKIRGQADFTIGAFDANW